MTPTPLRAVVAYLGLAYALALLVALALPDARVNLLLSVAIPTVVVGILTVTLHPRGSRRAVWASTGLRRAAATWWLPALAVPFVVCAGAYGAAVAIGAARPDALEADRVAGGLADLLVTLVLGSVLILGEEIGWRGYLLPQLQLLLGRRRAAVATGFAHGCFHLPLILLATTYDTGVSRAIAAPMAVAVITAGGVFYAWLRDGSGTVWPVAVAHNAVNTVFDLGAGSVTAVAGWNLSLVAGETGVATLAACGVLAAVLLRRARVWYQDAERPVAHRLVELA